MAERQLNERRFAIESVVDVVRARRSGLGIALEMGFPQVEANKVAVVISELGRNIKLYADEGFIIVTAYNDRIKIVVEDHGPGIPDVERLLLGSYTTSQGMGLGVPGAKRLMDEFDIQSIVGRGTKITAVKRLC